MKSRRKGLVRFSAALIVLAALLALYLRIGLFPGRLREKAMEKIGQWTHKKVVFDKVLFIPFHGVSFYRVGVFEESGEPLFQAKRVTMNARLVPFFQEKKIMVNRLLLERPFFDWALEGRPKKKPQTPPKTLLSGQIDVPVVPESRSLDLGNAVNGLDFFLPENVTIERIEISKGQVTVRRDRDSDPLETLSKVDVRMTLPQGPTLRFEGRVELGSAPYAWIDLTGVWNLQNGRYEFTFRTLSQKIPEWLLDYQKNNFLVLQEGQVSFETQLFSGEDSAVLFKTKASLENALLRLDPARYSGRMRLEAEGVFDNANKQFESYRGELTFVDVKVKDLSRNIRELDDLAGTLRFEPDRLVVHSLRGLYKKVAFDAAGTIRSFKDLLVDGEVRSHLTMDEMRSLLPPEYTEKLKDLIITGDCQALTVLSGSLRKDSRVESEHRLVVQNASVRDDAKNILWTQLHGEITLGREGLRIQNARFFVSEKPASLDAFIPKEAGSTGNLHLSSEGLDVRADYTAESDDLTLKNGRAVFTGVQASFSGKCVRWTDPWLELQGQAHVELDKIPQPFPIAGVLSGPFVLSGAWNKPLDWDLKMDAEGSPVHIHRSFRVDKLELQVRMKNRLLNIPYLHGSAYGGTANCPISVDLAGTNVTFKSKLSLNNLDLSKIGLDLAPPKEALKGTLIGNLSLEGQWQRPESYRGEGAVSVTRGFLGQSSRFKAMGHLPLLKVEGLELVTIEEMSSTFEVRDKKIHTQDLTLLGDAVDLSLRGTIGFDEFLDMTMSIQYSDAVLQGAALTGGLAPLLIQQAGNLISEYRVRGTVNKPTYEKMVLPTGRAVGKKISGLLQGLTS